LDRDGRAVDGLGYVSIGHWAVGRGIADVGLQQDERSHQRARRMAPAVQRPRFNIVESSVRSAAIRRT
jgi:hypothetical protein